MARRCLRKCTGCNESMVTASTSHRPWKNGSRYQCGIWRVADKQPRKL